MSRTPPTDPRSGEAPRGDSRLIIVAVALGILAVLAYNLHLSYVRNQARQVAFEVYRLTRSYAPGKALKKDHVKAVPVPEGFKDAFSGAIKDGDLENKIGVKFTRPARAEDILTYDMFRHAAADATSKLVPSGMVAKVLPVDSNTTATPILDPGMRVDILVSPAGLGRTLTVMERVEVVAVGSRTVNDPPRRRGGSFRSVTVAVTPVQARKLASIQSALEEEAFHLVVREPTDARESITDPSGVNPEVMKLIGQGG